MSASGQKILKLLEKLSTNLFFSKEELIDSLEISERTFYRYISELREAGFNVKTINGKYFLGQSERIKQIESLLYFTSKEFELLWETIDNIKASERVKQNLRDKLEYLFDSERFYVEIIGKTKARKLLLINEAIKKKKLVKLVNYRSSNSGKVSNRIIEPFDFTYNYISVVGYELGSDRIKLFRLSRFEDVEILDEDWKNIQKHIVPKIDCFNFSGKEWKKVEFIMTLKAKNLLEEEYPKAIEFITQLDTNRYLFSGQVLDFLGVGRFVLGLMDQIEVVGSEDFISFLRKKISSKKIF